jgi:hypothetical protein
MRTRFIFHLSLILAAAFTSFAGSADERQDYITGWSLALGIEAPAISAKDEQGTLRSFENLKLEHGLLLFFNRSADW